jgi:hypothetical protein
MEGDKMSIDHFHFVRGEVTTELTTPDKVAAVKQDHSIRVMWGGVDHEFFFENRAQAASTFEEWRRQACEGISLRLGGIVQSGGRLPIEEDKVKVHHCSFANAGVCTICGELL